MSESRPTITAAFLVKFIEAAPGRVRKRLDQQPDAATTWQWKQSENAWMISTGEETVRLQTDEGKPLEQTEAVSCSCLLSPKCFHLLACLTTLNIADETSVMTDQYDEAEKITSQEISSEQTQVSAAMKQTAQQCLRAIDAVLVSGSRASGLIVQSSLLRAAHQARAEGLVNLSAALIRVTEGIQRLRAGDDHTDCTVLRRDMVATVHAAHALLSNEKIPTASLGYARRPFAPTSIKRVTGVLAEPILTLSGYAGVVTHLIGDDGLFYQVVETRPGDAVLVGQAYRGGIDLGGTTASAQTISRARIDVQNLTSSPDGRLGKGNKTRWAIHPVASVNTAETSPHTGRWSAPLEEQVRQVFEHAEQAEWLPRGGWDLVSARGTVLGAIGNSVLFQVAESNVRLTLGISIDHQDLPFRENLQLLARCPGLAIEVYGRVRLDRAGWIDALSLRSLSAELVLPDSWAGRCHLGLDELKRQYFSNAERYATEVDESVNSGEKQKLPMPPLRSSATTDLFPGLEQRCLAMVVGGRGAIGSVGSATHRRDQVRLRSRGQLNAIQMLDHLAIVCAEPLMTTQPQRISEQTNLPLRPITLAIVDHYCRTARNAYERDKWLRHLSFVHH